MTRGYRLLDHTADFGLEITGENPAVLFARAALALADVIAGPLTAAGCHRRRVAVEGADWPDLMVNWLRELLYLWSGEQELLCDVEIAAIDETRLHAVVASVPYAPRHHEIRNEIKAVTYHQAEVVRQETGWVARVYLDV